MPIKSARMAFVFFFLVFSSLLSGCGVPTGAARVDLSRERYVSKIDPAQFQEYRGKAIIFPTIIDESKNTKNFYYCNPDETVCYSLFYSSTAMQQPLVSYYWYALKKAFESAGIRIVEDERFPDGELALTFKSLTDEEVQFTADLTKRNMAHSKLYTVRMPKVEARRLDLLEQRAYGMLDSIVMTILSDPGFHDAFFSTAAPSIQADQRYSSIKGIVLKNGETVRGKILSMGASEVKIQANDGTTRSYSFDKDVQTFIKD